MTKTKSKRSPPDIGLFMECEDEELNLAQKEFYSKIRKERNTFKKKLDDYINKTKGEIIIEEGDCFLFQIKHGVSASQTSLSAVENVQTSNQMSVPGTRHAPATQLPPTNSRSRRGTRAIAPAPAQVSPVVEQRGTRSSKTAPNTAKPAVCPPAPVTYARKTARENPLQPELTPSEATAIGGLCVGKKITNKISLMSGDAQEVVINKVPGKNYPSLTIVARPTLQLKPSLVNLGQTERANLDVQVKGVLMFTPTKFTEWLIQQGLIRSQQYDQKKNILKLGMYSDVSKFPYSGGYVWISELDPSVFVSVFNNSIFENSPYVPNVTLKLIYHWCCQTNVANVLQWVNVNSLFLKNIYMLLRAVCVLSVHNKYGFMGGPGKKVQIGLFNLQPTPDCDKAVRQEILGVFDPQAKFIRFHVANTEVSQKKRQQKKVLECLHFWVHRDSIICCDNSIKKEYLRGCGFTNFDRTEGSNKDIMEYLRKVLPKLFHHALPHLSRALIQQFLDELSWRERWGPIAAHAFNCLLLHLSDLTRENSPQNLLERLEVAASFPFGLPPVFYPDPTRMEVDETPKRGQKRSAEQPSSSKKIASNQEKAPVGNIDDTPRICSPDNTITAEIATFLSGNCKVSVESYYYGTIIGDDSKVVDRKPAEVLSTKCCICLKPFFDNLALMKHLLLHCQTKPPVVGPLRKVHQCSKCFLGFPTSIALRSHLSNVHYLPDVLKRFMCQICEKVFVDAVQFLYHMQRMHVASELPYSCKVCDFRCSSYDQIIEHMTHSHRCGQHIFCPYCLKTIGLFQENTPLPANVVFFINHVQRHQRSGGAQCHRCRLSFVNIPLLQRHLEKDHSSFSSNPNIRPLANGNVMMPEPGNLIKPALLPRLSKPLLKPGILTAKAFTPKVKFDASDLTCAECEGFLDSPDHFMGEIKCNRCRFTSCCENAVLEHFAIYHEANQPPAFCPGKPALLTSSMYCSCGYFSSSPNTLAKHLVTCGKTTAYPSEASARIALQNEGKRSYDDEPTVLNMLGLVRKSPERMAVDDRLEPRDADLAFSSQRVESRDEHIGEDNEISIAAALEPVSEPISVLTSEPCHKSTLEPDPEIPLEPCHESLSEPYSDFPSQSCHEPTTAPCPEDTSAPCPEPTSAPCLEVSEPEANIDTSSTPVFANNIEKENKGGESVDTKEGEARSEAPVSLIDELEDIIETTVETPDFTDITQLVESQAGKEN